GGPGPVVQLGHPSRRLRAARRLYGGAAGRGGYGLERQRVEAVAGGLVVRAGNAGAARRPSRAVSIPGASALVRTQPWDVAYRSPPQTAAARGPLDHAPRRSA